MVSVNYTIDDQYGDEITGRLVEYSPASRWSQGNGCAGCAAKPDPNSTFRNTWHDGSFSPGRDIQPLTLTFKFNGTGVYLFNVLNKLVLTDVNVIVDERPPTRFTIIPNIDEYYEYNVPVFALDSLDYGEHTVTLSASRSNYTIVLFDYAMYTTPNVTAVPTLSASPTSAQTSAPTTAGAGSITGSSSHKPNIGAIVGGITGGIIFFILILALAFWWIRRRYEPSTVTPYEDPRRRDVISNQADEETLAKTSEKNRSDYVREDSVVPLTYSVSDAPSSSISPPSDIAAITSDNQLRESAQILRDQLAALRSEQPAAEGSASGESNAASSRTARAVALEEEVHDLRKQVQVLRAQQEQGTSTSPTTPQTGTTELMHEIAVLRAEIDEIRMHQADEALPSYSPPARPLPGVIFNHGT
ncbi:hypothetical protein BDW22DRAFT_1425354 [Trametopsis cervina]|nr:hypothetical protein BDW22DRAFT_1425354 [Trametopsis cervina]